MYYIEKEEEGKFFNPTSSTVEINPGFDNETCTPNKISDNDSNLYRWKWVKNFKDLDFKQKLSVFLPMCRYINLRDFQKDEFENEINKTIVDTTYYLCRPLVDFKIQSNSQDIPILIMEFDKVDFTSAPTEYASYLADIRNWYLKYGFEYDCGIEVPDICIPDPDENPDESTGDSENTCENSGFLV